MYREHAKFGLDAQSINFGLFLRKAGGISNLMRTLQNLDLSTTARNFLGPFSESARNFHKEWFLLYIKNIHIKIC